MENIILIVHLIIALALVGVVLLQRSEGGALGIGGGGGGSFMSGRSTATALTKLTWILGALFISSSLVLTVIAVRGDRGTTVIDIGSQPEANSSEGVDILIPKLDDEPATPPAPEVESEAEGEGTTEN